MDTVEVVTSWIGDGVTPIGEGQVDAHRPRLMDDYSLFGWTDITGQPAENIEPDPNSYVVLAEAEPEVIEQISNDENYVLLNPNVTSVPTLAQWAAFANKLARMRDTCGLPIWSRRQIRQAIGSEASGMTWGEINQRVIDYLANAPKEGCNGV